MQHVLSVEEYNDRLEKKEVYGAQTFHGCETFLSVYFKGKLILS